MQAFCATENPCTTRICVVGSGTHFLSGISYFTLHLASALSQSVPVSVLLLRRLIPRVLYPGRNRVGAQLTRLEYPPSVPVFDGIDWFWLPSMVRAIRFLRRERPTHLVIQWWTGAVLHSLVLLAIMARLQGAKIIMEFHEVQDPGESRLALARWYVRRFSRILISMCEGFVVHSEYDLPHVRRRFRLGSRPVRVIPHGPYTHHDLSGIAPSREAPPDTMNLLFFGTIRPYKGVEDLVRAFELLCEEDPDAYWLTVVGEEWEGWTIPRDRIAGSRFRQRITFDSRYVDDDDVNRWFAGADAVVLPYHRSSASGPLHVSMSVGLPVVVTAVGGLPEAAGDYGGAVFVPPSDPIALAGGIREVGKMRGLRFSDPHSWAATTERMLALLHAIDVADHRATQVPAWGRA